MVLFPALGIKGSSDRVFVLWCTAVWSFIYINADGQPILSGAERTDRYQGNHRTDI